MTMLGCTRRTQTAISNRLPQMHLLWSQQGPRPRISSVVVLLSLVIVHRPPRRTDNHSKHTTREWCSPDVKKSSGKKPRKPSRVMFVMASSPSPRRRRIHIQQCVREGHASRILMYPHLHVRMHVEFIYVLISIPTQTSISSSSHVINSPSPTYSSPSARCGSHWQHRPRRHHPAATRH